MKNLKKYKYIGNEEEAHDYADPKPQIGCIYEEDITIGARPVRWWADATDSVSYEWEEVVEEEASQQTVSGSPEINPKSKYINLKCTFTFKNSNGETVETSFESTDREVFKLIYNSLI